VSQNVTACDIGLFLLSPILHGLACRLTINMNQISVAQDKGDDSWKTGCKDIAILYLSLKHHISKEFASLFFLKS
jgi:hypothetical protein